MPTFSGENEELISNNPEDRQKMKEYWLKHSQMANMQEMLLDSNAEELSDHELPEILSILPSFKSKKILELGAGIGRFTRVLAQKASSVIAVDFIERFLEKNRLLNADLDNIDYACSDVTKIAFEKNSNWLLMYLNNAEVFDLIEKSLHYLKEGGYFFFRESCFHASGNIKKVDKDENPTEYRSPTNYVELFQSKTITVNDNDYGFELVFARPSRTYIEMKNNSNQVFFLFQKVKLETHHGFKTIKEFFDHNQYTNKGILRYEKIFGTGFVSTGGQTTTSQFLEQLDLKSGQRVLDVGCGIGGGICWDRAQNQKNLKVRFEIGDVTKHEYPLNYFDVIYTRDTLLHISNKQNLFNRFKSWLKPGGKLFITDYTCGAKPWSDQFVTYVEQRGYDLLTIEEYESLLKEYGFVNIKAEDKTQLFHDYLKKELNDFVAIKDEFVNEFSIHDFTYIVEGWKEKIVRTEQGHQKYAAIYAEKK